MRPWEENIRKVVPYVPGEQPKDNNLIKLNTNENPYPPAPETYTALTELDYKNFKKYPDPSCSILIEALADFYGIKKDEIFVGAGSDDVIGMSFLTFFNSDKPILFPDVSYSFYKVWAELYNIPYELKKLDDNLCINYKDYYTENGGIIFPNPNAPTGVLLPAELIEDIIQHNQNSVVIIDEAYIDFGGESVLPLINKYDNLLVVQTFSKSRAAAGLRIGYAMGNARLIKALNDVKYSYNSYTMSTPVLFMGAAILKNRQYFEEQLKKIIKTRENAKKELALLGFTCTDSMSNFLFVKHENYYAGDIFEALKKEHIYVRYFNTPPIDNYLRITVGTDDEMQVLYSFLKNFLKP